MSEQKLTKEEKLLNAMMERTSCSSMEGLNEWIVKAVAQNNYAQKDIEHWRREAELHKRLLKAMVNAL